MRFEDVRGYDLWAPDQIRVADGILADGTTVYDALAKGLDDLMDLCNVVEEKFVAAKDEFERDREGERMEM